MTNLIKKISAVIAISTLSQTGFSNTIILLPDDSEVQVGDLQSGGSGCPQDSNLSYRSVSGGIVVTYSELNVGVNTDSRIDRKACNLRLPLFVPAGKMIVAELITTGSSRAIDSASNLKIRQELFFTGRRGPVSEIELRASQRRFQLGRNNVIESGLCGQDVTLASNLNATLIKRDLNSNAQARVRSSFIRFKLVDCTQL